MTSTFHRIQVYLSSVAGPTLRNMTCQRMISRHLFFITHFSIYINLFTIYHTKILSLKIYYFVSNWPLVKNLCQEKKIPIRTHPFYKNLTKHPAQNDSSLPSTIEINNAFPYFHKFKWKV